MKDEQKAVYALSNGDIADNFEWPKPPKINPVLGSRPSDHYFRSVGLSVCLSFYN